MPAVEEPRDLIEFVDQADMQQIITEWDRYDKNQDGTITKEEFLAGERAWYKSVNAGEEISDEELFNNLEVHRVVSDLRLTSM